MPVPFIMPKLDMDQEKATIISWEKHEGDIVKMDETVLTVETDKVAVEVPCPADGVLAGIRYQNGDTVPVTTVIASVLKQGETLADLPKDTVPTSAPKQEVAPPQSVGVPVPAVTPVVATPVAARMAREEGLDLSKVQASGNRITREDVEHYLAGQASPTGRVATTATPAVRRVAQERNVLLGAVAGSGPRGRVQAAGGCIPDSPSTRRGLERGRPADVVPLVGIRQRIAERMQASFQELPHIALTTEVDVSALKSVRLRLNERGSGRGSASPLGTARENCDRSMPSEGHPCGSANGASPSGSTVQSLGQEKWNERQALPPSRPPWLNQPMEVAL